MAVECGGLGRVIAVEGETNLVNGRNRIVASINEIRNRILIGYTIAEEA
jgi:hypothetical protein